MKIIGKPIVIPKKKKARTYCSKAAWVTIGEKKYYFRSSWETKYAKFLEFLKQQNLILEWEHEPQTFWFDKIKRGTRSYLPDFKVTRNDGTYYWVEVKGYLDSKSNTKIKRFNKYFPKEELYVISKEWFRSDASKVSMHTSKSMV